MHTSCLSAAHEARVRVPPLSGLLRQRRGQRIAPHQRPQSRNDCHTPNRESYPGNRLKKNPKKCRRHVCPRLMRRGCAFRRPANSVLRDVGASDFATAKSEDAQFVGRTSIAPTEQSAYSYHPFPLFFGGGAADREQTQRGLWSGAMGWVTCLRRLKGMMPLRIPTPLTRGYVCAGREVGENWRYCIGRGAILAEW